MKRRKFLGAAVAGAGAASLSAPAIAQGRTVLRLASAWGANVGLQGQAPDRLAARVAAVTDGRIAIERVADGTYGTPSALLTAVSNGDIQMYFAKEEMWRDQNPAFALFTSVPGGMNADELEGFVHYGDGQFFWDTMAAEQGIKPYLGGDLGPTALWSRDPIADLSGLTALRTASMGLGVDALAQLGAGDLAEIGQDAGLPAGVRIDAFEGLTTAQVQAAGLQSSHRHMTHPGFNRPNCALSYGLNLATFTGLSETDREVIAFCIAAEHADFRYLALIENTSAMNQMKADGSVTETPVPDGLWDAQRPSTEAMFAAIEPHDFTAADAVGSYRYFLEDVSIWSEFGKASYVTARNRTLKGLAGQ